MQAGCRTAEMVSCNLQEKRRTNTGYVGQIILFACSFLHLWPRSLPLPSVSPLIRRPRSKPLVFLKESLGLDMATASLRLSVLTLVIVLLATVGSPAASAARLRRRPRTPYRIGGADGWRVPPPEDKEYYIKWASPIAFYVSDSIEFTYRNDYTVIKVSKAGYYHCNETVGIVAMPSNGSNFFFLDQPGYFYFTSVELDHCKKGERLMINVLADAEPLAPSSLPSSAAAPGQASSLSPSSAPAPSHSTEYATAAAETPGPSPSTEYATAATGASFAHALAWPVTLTLAWLISFILISVVSMCIYRRLRQRQLRRRHDRLRRSPTLAWLISGCQHVNLATY